MRPFTVVGLGEVLWDLFPDDKQLGGAPSNFAYISNLLGENGVVASRVGRDALGDEVAERLARLGLSTESLQRDAVHPTGTVNVQVGNDGQPRFEIVENVAWDFLEWNEGLETLAKAANAVCFGSLAQRSVVSRRTITRFLESTRKQCVRVFDVNLRQSFFTSEILGSSARHADILKLNHDEMPVLMRVLGGPALDAKAAAQWLLEKFDLKLVAVTRGASGSLLMAADDSYEHPGHPVKVVDTVGAGDAFTATLVHHFLRGSGLAEMSDAANRMGAWVAGQPGATPASDSSVLGRVRARNA